MAADCDAAFYARSAAVRSTPAIHREADPADLQQRANLRSFEHLHLGRKGAAIRPSRGALLIVTALCRAMTTVVSSVIWMDGLREDEPRADDQSVSFH